MICKIKRKIILFFIGITTLTLTVQSCSEEDLNTAIDVLSYILSQTGWLQSEEDLDGIPGDITPYDGDETVKSSVNLAKYFPPVGDQGDYGTCITWSTGYNLKTALNAIDYGWTAKDLAATSNQTSPKDLFLAIPSGSKGSNCNGTNFAPALDVLISSGCSSMSSVPYTNMGGCSGSGKGDSSNKLTNYRKIAYNENGSKGGMELKNFQGYLSADRPIAIGAKLGDNFMTWKGSSVIYDDTYNNPGMQHAYHAMVVIGYDNTKSAFLVRNSWGTSWGNNGDIWVDYDYFFNKFCFAAFVAENASTKRAAVIAEQSSDYDLATYSAEDWANTEATDPTYRCFSYNVVNSGLITIYPSQKWSVTYMYYNATKANDYGILYEDYYTNEFGNLGDFGNYTNTSALNACWNNTEIEPGKIAGADKFGSNGFQINYKMPNITGKYYLLIMADAYNKIAEANENNNFYFISANGKPLEFVNGVAQNMPSISPKLRSATIKQFGDTETQTVVKPGNLNAYTPAEIQTMLLHDKKTGKLDQKIAEFRAANASNSNKPIKTKRK